MQTPSKEQIAKAREVVSHPEHYCATPALLQNAWEVLKAARGSQVDYRGTGEPRYRIEHAARAHLLSGRARPRQRRLSHAARAGGDDAA
jgi:ribosomal protein L35